MPLARSHDKICGKKIVFITKLSHVSKTDFRKESVFFCFQNNNMSNIALKDKLRDDFR